MPTKNNWAGKQQPYVPKGNGDISGEYADKDGWNENFRIERPNLENKQQDRDLVSKEGTPAERMKLKQQGISTITENMKNVEYTQKFTQNRVYKHLGGEVNIAKQALTKDEIGLFNSVLQEYFDQYPQMQKFGKITVNKQGREHRGGNILTKTWAYKEKEYQLYINSGWLDKESSQQRKQNIIKEYEKRIANIKRNMETKESIVLYPEELIKSYTEAIEKVKIDLEKGEEYNNCFRFQSRENRLKNIVHHEMMHRVYFDNVEDNYELKSKLTDIYKKAVENGDALKISKYATTSREEFCSEANAAIECGQKVPEYIKNMIYEIRNK